MRLRGAIVVPLIIMLIFGQSSTSAVASYPSTENLSSRQQRALEFRRTFGLDDDLSVIIDAESDQRYSSTNYGVPLSSEEESATSAAGAARKGQSGRCRLRVIATNLGRVLHRSTCPRRTSLLVHRQRGNRLQENLKDCSHRTAASGSNGSSTHATNSRDCSSGSWTPGTTYAPKALTSPMSAQTWLAIP